MNCFGFNISQQCIFLLTLNHPIMFQPFKLHKNYTFMIKITMQIFNYRFFSLIH